MGRFITDQRGSLPLTLFVAIIVGGTIAVLFGIVQSGIGSSGRDRDFASAIQVADAGLQEGYVRLGDALLAQVEDDDFEFTGIQDCDQPAWFDGENGATSGACIGDLGEGQFDWEYSCDMAAQACEVLSVGRHRSSSRAVQVEVRMQSMSQSGFTGKERAGWPGGGNPSGEPFWVGTFGCLTLPASNPGAIVGVNYHGDNLAEDQQNCWQPNYAKDLPVATNTGPDFDNDPAEMECQGEDVILENVPKDAIRGQTYCVERAYFPMDFNIQDPSDEPASEEPVKIYVYNPSAGNNAEAVRVGGGGGPNALEPRVNWSDSGAGKASDLQVFVGRTSGDVVLRPNDSRAAMVVWAPGSTCTVTSNGEFSGTLTCFEVVINGTYEFDSTAEETVTQLPVMQRLTEERVPEERRGFQEEK